MAGRRERVDGGIAAGSLRPRDREATALPAHLGRQPRLRLLHRAGGTTYLASRIDPWSKPCRADSWSTATPERRSSPCTNPSASRSTFGAEQKGSTRDLGKGCARSEAPDVDRLAHPHDLGCGGEDAHALSRPNR